MRAIRETGAGREALPGRNAGAVGVYAAGTKIGVTSWGRVL